MDLCSICREPVEADAEQCHIRPCGHTFHCMCVSKWFAFRLNCPMCRAPVTELDGYDHVSTLLVFALSFGDCLDRLYRMPSSEVLFEHHELLASLLFFVCTKYLETDHTMCRTFRHTMDSCWKCWNQWQDHYFGEDEASVSPMTD